MKKKYKYILIAILLLLPVLYGNSYTVGLEAQKDRTLHEDLYNLLSKYSLSCTEYKALQLQNQFDKITYSEYEALLEQNGNSDLLSHADHMLQSQLYSFYEKEEENILMDKQKAIEFNLLAELLKIPVYDSEIEYLTEMSKEWENEYNTALAKYKKGYITEYELKSIKANLNVEKTNLEIAKEERNALLLKLESKIDIENNMGIFKIKVPEIETEGYYLEQYVKKPDFVYCSYKEKAYEQYKQYLYDYCPKSGSYINKASILLEMVKLEKESLMKEIKENITLNLSKYNNSARKIASFQKQLEALNLKISKNELLLKEGFIKQNDVIKLQVEKEKILFDIENEQYNQNVAYFTLYYGIIENN